MRSREKLSSKAINALARRLSKTNKVRNRVVITGMILTTLLLTVLFSIVFTVNQSTLLQSLKELGTVAEGAYKDITMEQYNVLKDCNEFDDISYNVFIGNAVNSEFSNRGVEVRYTEEKAAEWSFCQLEQGHFPVTNDEIVVDDIICNNIGTKPIIGKKITLEILIEETIITDEFTICGYYKGNQTAGVSQAFISMNYMDKAINKGDIEEAYSAVQAFCRFDKKQDTEQFLSDIWLKNGFPGTNNIAVNWVYENAHMDGSTIACIIIALIIILLSGYLLIYNIFYISIVNDTHLYGLLKLIGMNHRQIKGLLSKQIQRLYCIGIPIGLILGWMIGNWVLPKVLSTQNIEDNNIVIFNPWIFVLSTLFTIITVWISMRKPYRIIKRLPAIEAINFNGVDEISKLKVHTKKKVHIGDMARRNLYRSKKKTILVMSSMTLVFILFLLLTTIVNSISFEKFLEYKNPCDFFITTNSFLNDYKIVEIEKDEYQQFEDMTGYQRISPFYYQESIHFLSSAQLDELHKLKEQEEFEMEVQDELDGIIERIYQNGQDNYGIQENRYYFDSDTIDQFDVIEGVIDDAKLNSGHYVIIIALINDVENITNYHAGDKITLCNETKDTKVVVGEDGQIEYENLDQTEYTVLAVVKPSYALSIRLFNGYNINTILPIKVKEELPEEAKLFAIGMDADASMIGTINSKINEYLNVNTNLSYNSTDTVTEEMDNLQMMIIIIGGGLVFIIGLIAIINYINGCITGIISRKREFLTLHAVGMTDRQILYLLKLENLYVVGCAAFISFAMGTFMCYFGIKRIEHVIRWLQFNYSFVPILVIFSIVYVIALCTPNIVYKKIVKHHQIE